MRRILQTLTLFTLFVAWISVSTAQTNGTLSGKITVRAGEAVPNATVIVTNTSTGASQRVLTAPDGSFTLVGLAPGTYRVEVESAGFKRSSQQNVELNAGSPADVKIVLEAGDTATTVEAQATTRNLQDENGEIAKSLGTNVINELPVLDRNYQAYMDLFPGVTPPTTAGGIVASPQQNRVWNTNGQPNSSNLRLMDGAKNHEPATGQSIVVMPMQAVRQMNVVNSGHEAQYGRVGGSILNTQTSPGTNDFHGNLFYLHSNNSWNARNYFNQSPADQARYRSSQFGGAVGGKIVPDRVFFYGAYEGDYLREGRTQIATVPTAEFRSGNFGGVPNLNLFYPGLSSGNRIPVAGNMVPASMINPTSRAIANALPLPNQPGLINNYVGNPADRSDGNRAIGRLDFYLTEDTNLFVRYGYSNFLTFSPSILGSEELGGGSNGRLRNHNGAVSMTHRFSPTLTVDALAGYTRYNNRQWGTGIADASAFGFGNVTANGQLPNINIGGLQIGNDPLGNYSDITDSYNLAANAAWSTGRHNLKFGFDIWHSRMSGFERSMFGRNSGYTFGPGATLNMGGGIGDLGGFPSAFAGFLLGSPTQVNGFTQGIIPQFRTSEYAGYIADTFRVTDRLSLSLGVRYSAFSPVESREQASFFNFGTSQFSPFEEGDTDLSGAQPWDTNNFAPRFGFSYRLGERTVVRGAYAITYFRPNLTWFSQSLLPQGFQSFQQGLSTGYQSVTGNFAQLPLTAQGSGAAGELPTGATALLRDDIETPYLQSYNFQVQHDFGRGASLDVAYVGNLGRHLPLTQNLNAAAAGSGIAGLPIAGRTAPLYELSTGLTSNYNALQATFNKRFTNWIAFAGQYTWSKALDYGDGMMPLMNSLNRRDNYGPADWDRRHIFTLSHVWEPLGANFRRSGVLGALLGGWKVSGILRAASGSPVTLTADPLLCACPGNTPRADVVGVGTVTRIIPEPTIYGFFVGIPYDFPVFEFQQPQAGTQGNLSRNSIQSYDFWDRGAWNYDASVTKAFQISEQNRLELKGDMFNVLNTPHFATPILDVNNVNFGRSFATTPGFGARTIRIGARYIF